MQPINKFGSRRGNAMIEFAAATGILIPLFIGTFQFGYTFYVYNLISTQMRAGARYASMKTYKGSDGTSSSSPFKTAVKNIVLYGDPNPARGAKVMEPGLKASQIDVEIKGSDGVTDASATVQPTMVYVRLGTVTTAGCTSDCSYTLDAVITKFALSGKPIATFPYVGTWAPAE
jgi:Flp pilus assembly protein TadG